MNLLVGIAVLLAVLAVAATHDIEKRQTRRLRVRPEGSRRKNTGRQSQVADPTPAGKRVVCYYTNWSVYRKGIAKFLPTNINPYLCTHLVYAFGGLTDEYEITVFDSYQDIDKGGYSQFNALKQYNKNLRTLLAVGGWNEGSGRFSELVSYPESRKTFIISALRHLRRYNFDGLDLDWEYPASRPGSLPEDKENYALLVKELRETFEDEARKSNKRRLLLTMAVPAGQSYIDNGYDIPTLNTYLDFFNILNYDYHTSIDPVVRNHAALLALPGTSEYEETYKLNVDWTVKYYAQLGADKNKLVVGIPTYGRSFTLADGAYNDIGASANGAGNEGNYTNEKGFLAFYEVCYAMATDGWQARKPYPRSVGPYAFKDDQWVGYDDEGMVATKAEYVRDTGLGGIMFWSLDTDDFRGICNGQQYLLVEAGKAALLSPPPADLNALDRRRPAISHALPTTPLPPTTPSPIPVFNCKREGFHPNPDNCHQYFWCLDSGAAGQGIVAHTFTCPSGLVFSRTIDGCEHPERAKCIEKKSRGGAAESKQTPTIPTTTPFPEFDYDYYYYYDDEDYLDANVVPDEPVVQDIALQSTPAPSTRNSGGAQFSRIEAEVPSARERNRPQYTVITRDRTNVAEEPTEAELSVAPGGNNGRRPQYTSISRNRPATETPAVENLDEVTPSNRLNYVTIDRVRPSTPDQPRGDLQQIESSTQPGLQYVTLRRASSRTSPAPDLSSSDNDSPNLISINTDSFRQRPPTVKTTPEPTTTTTTTTTTPKPARLVVPQGLFDPVTQNVNHLLLLDPRNRQRQRTANTQIRERTRLPPSPRTSTEAIVTERATLPSLRTTTTEFFTEYTEKIIPEISQNDHQLEYDIIPDLLPVTETISEFDHETSSASSHTTEKATTSPVASSDSVPDDNIAITTEAETRGETITSITEATTFKTTINLLADFPALASAAPDVVENIEEAKPLDEPRSGAAAAEEDLTPEVPAIIPDVTELQQPSTRRPITLPPRPRRPETPAPRQGTTEAPQRRRPQLPERRTPARFTPQRSSGADASTRRSVLQRPTPRPDQDIRTRDRPNLQSRFRPQSEQDRQNKPSRTDQAEQLTGETQFERNRNRFTNRPRNQNRFRLSPVAVTTPAPRTPARTRRPRPSGDRQRIRPNNQIRFTSRQETTIEPVVEVTEPPHVIEPEQTVSPNIVFSSLFGENDEIATTTTQPIEHKILERQKFDELFPETLFPTSSPAPVTEAQFNFEDFFTSTLEYVTDGTTTTSTPIPTTTSTTTTSTSTSPATTITRRSRPKTTRTSPAPRTTATTARPTITSATRPPRRFTEIPPSTTTKPYVPPRRGGRPPKPRSSTFRPTSQIADYLYDYFYDDEAGALGGTLGELAELTEKALLLPGGKVKCFDTGYFAHPESCKKFISCSKTVRGAVRGWVYTCPQQLVFDPVGGMCNWAEAVDCKAVVV